LLAREPFINSIENMIYYNLLYCNLLYCKENYIVAGQENYYPKDE